jgi:VIT family
MFIPLHLTPSKAPLSRLPAAPLGTMQILNCCGHGGEFRRLAGVDGGAHQCASLWNSESRRFQSMYVPPPREVSVRRCQTGPALSTAMYRSDPSTAMFTSLGAAITCPPDRYSSSYTVRTFTSAVTIAGSYVVGGLVPLAPYFVLRSMGTALVVSVLVTVLALLVFGYVKGTFTGKRPFRSAWQTVVVGGLAAAAAFAIAKLIA